MPARSRFLLALFIATPCLASAQSVVPSLTLHTQHLDQSSVAWRFLVITDTSERELATMQVTTKLIEHAGKPAMLSVHTFVSPGGQIIDSALAYRGTLAPIWQHSHQPTKTMLLDFDAMSVTGVLTPKDSATRAVKQALGGRAFDTTDLDEVVSSLPYATGYSAVLPFYVFEHGVIERDTVSVIGVESMAAPGGALRAVWKVSFSDPAISATYWIDQETRKVLRRDITQRRTGVRFRSIPLS